MSMERADARGPEDYEYALAQRGSSYFSVTVAQAFDPADGGAAGGTNWQATMLPLDTIMPFLSRLPCSPSLLASQASEL